jgi:hypothetical protein
VKTYLATAVFLKFCPAKDKMHAFPTNQNLHTSIIKFSFIGNQNKGRKKEKRKKGIKTSDFNEWVSINHSFNHRNLGALSL